MHKTDGAIWFCVDYLKLSHHTFQDANAILCIEYSLHLLAGSEFDSKFYMRGTGKLMWPWRIRRDSLLSGSSRLLWAQSDSFWLL